MKAADVIRFMARKTSASPPQKKLLKKLLKDIGDDTHRPSNTSPTHTTVAVNCS